MLNDFTWLQLFVSPSAFICVQISCLFALQGNDMQQHQRVKDPATVAQHGNLRGHGEIYCRCVGFCARYHRPEVGEQDRGEQESWGSSLTLPHTIYRDTFCPSHMTRSRQKQVQLTIRP